MPVYFLPTSEAELLAAQAWYDERADGLGDRFFDAVDGVVARIAVADLATWRLGEHFTNTFCDFIIGVMGL